MNFTKVEEVFKGKLLRVYCAQKLLPNGFRVELEMVKHPGAVLIVPFLKPQTLAMIRQYRPVINAYIWELPAGTLKPREYPLVCAHRELIEEIGYSAKRLKRLGLIYPAAGYTTEKIIIYEARGLKKVEACLEPDEVIEVKPLAKKEINKLFLKGKIVDAKTICALRLAKII